MDYRMKKCMTFLNGTIKISESLPKEQKSDQKEDREKTEQCCHHTFSN